MVLSGIQYCTTGSIPSKTIFETSCYCVISIVGEIIKDLYFECLLWKNSFFICCCKCILAHLAKGWGSYCHHLASVFVVCQQFFQKNSSQKLLDRIQWKWKWLFHRVSCTQWLLNFFIPVQAWLLLLKIETEGSECSFSQISVKPVGFYLNSDFLMIRRPPRSTL